MNNSIKARAIVLATLMVLSPTASLAQGAGSTTTGTTANDVARAQTVQPERDDNDFPWGLLGLLGLAGLLGRKRDDHVRVDRTSGSTNNR